MPKLNQVRCVLAVNDHRASAAFYREKLGFKLDLEVEGWFFLSRDNFKVMLGHCPDQVPAAKIGDHSWFAYADMDDVDGLYTEYKAKGVKIIQELVNRPWGTREFSIETPDGHRIMFGQEIKIS
jgi:catechol 2,3-dioxygenase-like lactoylglutathione lyase family enzyme